MPVSEGRSKYDYSGWLTESHSRCNPLLRLPHDPSMPNIRTDVIALSRAELQANNDPDAMKM